MARTPSVSGKAAATSCHPGSGLEEGGFKRKEADASTNEMSEADAAYANAVEVCNRLVRELEDQLKGSKYDGTERRSTGNHSSPGQHVPAPGGSSVGAGV